MKSIKERAPDELAAVKNRVARSFGRGHISPEDMTFLTTKIQELCDYIEQMEETDDSTSGN